MHVMSTLQFIVMFLYQFNFVYPNITAPGVIGVVFSPENGILHVGDETEIRCIPVVGERGVPLGSIVLKDLGKRTDLISIDKSRRAIKPPNQEPVYPKYGSTSVECKHEASGNPSNALIQSLDVRILPKALDGTLDGENSGNPEVTAGSTKEFRCNLVPLDAAESLNGKWKATVQPAGAAAVTELEGGKWANITPPNAQGYQNQPSSFSVSCTFSTPDGTEIHNFERTITVKRISFKPPLPSWFSFMNLLVLYISWCEFTT
ncbi:hypothetical protein CRM22_001534 [Opisthorchis felineus]|uniref:Ig-like domain-containing protein n=1 Tax=Opisthorchis felineus TaxID=147828 RepID=A0A4S2MA68_OPIFE|nr:hypothetical protein CRM22_001534 [Opisthorchis felineus]